VRRASHLETIDGLRALAVLAVLGYHALVHAWTGTAPAWIACGARGVDLFFAISGFCLAFPYLRAYRSAGVLEIGYGRFMVRRIARIVPPYLAALALFALLSLTSFGLPTAPGVHLTPAAALRELGLESVFLTDMSPAYDASFWTLGVEMRWYLLFPLLLELYVRSRMGFYLVGGLCYALYFLTPWSVADEGTLPCFMLGIVAADLHLAESPLRRFAPVVAVVTLAAAALWQSRVDWVDHGNPLWHAAAFSLVVASGSGLFARALRWKALAFTGVASYSIYLIHQPVLDALAAAGAPAPVAAAAALACGFAFYFAVERRALDPRFRKPAEALLSKVLTPLLKRPIRAVRSGS
jgi:peptidoglycan/LPS O-acetylase OafA/YrhL